MNKKRKKINTIVIGTIIGLLLLGSAVAFAGSGTAFSLVAAKPEVSVMLSGTVTREDNQIPLAKLESVKPGEVLHWTISSENKGEGVANDYRAVGKIPAGTSF